MARDPRRRPGPPDPKPRRDLERETDPRSEALEVVDETYKAEPRGQSHEDGEFTQPRGGRAEESGSHDNARESQHDRRTAQVRDRKPLRLVPHRMIKKLKAASQAQGDGREDQGDR